MVSATNVAVATSIPAATFVAETILPARSGGGGAAIYFAVCYPVSQLLLLLERKVHAGTPLTPARRRRMAKARGLLEGSPVR